MQTDDKGSVESPPLEINNVERIEYDLVTLEDETLLRRSPDGQWQQSEWIEGWTWMDLSPTDSRTLALEELYQGDGLREALPGL